MSTVRSARPYSCRGTPALLCTPHPSFTQLSAPRLASHIAFTFSVVDVLAGFGERRAFARSHSFLGPRFPQRHAVAALTIESFWLLRQLRVQGKTAAYFSNTNPRNGLGVAYASRTRRQIAPALRKQRGNPRSHAALSSACRCDDNPYEWLNQILLARGRGNPCNLQRASASSTGMSIRCNERASSRSAGNSDKHCSDRDAG